MFVNRESELKNLNDEYRKKRSSFVVIFGRRRVGKTTLIKEFVKNKDYIYFQADLQNEVLQIQRFKSIFSEKYKDINLFDTEFNSWDGLFAFFIKNRANKKDKKLIIVIDEFQYLVRVNPSIPSIFQRIWDDILSKSNVMFIISGSSVSMMYQSVLNYNSPLYGRRTLQIHLKPMGFFEFKKFFNDQDLIKIFEFYSVIGGIPKYIELLDLKKSLKWNIENKILNKSEFLYFEPKFLLNEDFNNLTNYFSIMEAISSGKHKIGNISKRLKVKVNNLSSFIDKLILVELIEREVPVTEENPSKSKKGLYFIKDNFIKFWFTFVFPFQSYIEMDNIKFVVDKVNKSFNNYVSRNFEKVSTEFLIKNRIPFEFMKIGRWWNKNNEIDIVGIGENKILFGECKYSENRVGKKVLDELIEKSKLVEEYENYEKYYVIFSKKGFKKELLNYGLKIKNLFLFSISDF